MAQMGHRGEMYHPALLPGELDDLHDSSAQPSDLTCFVLPHQRGEDVCLKGYAGLEVLLLSFSGCVSTTLVYLLRKMGKDVSGFQMRAEGITTRYPFSLQKILCNVVLESRNASDSDLQTVIRQAKEVAPVWLACKNNIEVSMEYRLIKV